MTAFVGKIRWNGQSCGRIVAREIVSAGLYQIIFDVDKDTECDQQLLDQLEALAVRNPYEGLLTEVFPLRTRSSCLVFLMGNAFGKVKFTHNSTAKQHSSGIEQIFEQVRAVAPSLQFESMDSYDVL